MNAHVESTPGTQAEPTHEDGKGLMTRVRRLPVISWIWPEQHSAEAGAGCGVVGGACCAGGAVGKGLGLARAASGSSLAYYTTPFFLVHSPILILCWGLLLLPRI